MPQFLGTPKVQYFKTGQTDYLVGGKVYTYEPGTLVPKATYFTIEDAINGTNPNTNPIILDSRGEATIVLTGGTKIVLYDADDNEIWSVDGFINGDVSTDILDGSGNIILSFIPANTPANYWTLANSATTNPVRFFAEGSDANIDARVFAKGSGDLVLDGGLLGDVVLGANSSGAISLVGDTGVSGNFSVSGVLTSATSTITNLTIPANGAILYPDPATATFQLIPTGSVMWYAGTTLPAGCGWLECDGTNISRTTYSRLFTAIGTAFGVGDGSTTFTLPAQARKTLVGRGGTGSGTLANTIGSTGGAETHTLTLSQTPAHTHDWSYPSTFVIGGSAFSIGGSGFSSTIVTGISGTTTSNGGGTAHNNLQPSLVMMMIIRI